MQCLNGSIVVGHLCVANRSLSSACTVLVTVSFMAVMYEKIDFRL